jgi:hypothetical protein
MAKLHHIDGGYYDRAFKNAKFVSPKSKEVRRFFDGESYHGRVVYLSNSWTHYDWECLWMAIIGEDWEDNVVRINDTIKENILQSGPYKGFKLICVFDQDFADDWKNRKVEFVHNELRIAYVNLWTREYNSTPNF